MCYIISFSSLAIVIIVGVNYNANSTIVAFIFVSIIIAFKIITFLKSNYIELAKTHKSWAVKNLIEKTVIKYELKPIADIHPTI